MRTRYLIASIICTILWMILLVGIVRAGQPEKWYQQKWCAQAKGKMEVVMPDGSRCDCLTSTHAVEFDFAKKWAESLGQALCYSAQTGRRGGIVLIMGSPEDSRYLDRLEKIIKQFDLPIDTWPMKGSGK